MNQKKLSEVTLEDAKQIIETGYDKIFSKNFNQKNNIIHIDGCKFIFFDTLIKFINNIERSYSAVYQCYIEAHKLGYYIPELSEYIDYKMNEAEYATLQLQYGGRSKTEL